MADYEFKTLRAGAGTEGSDASDADERSDRSDGDDDSDVGLAAEEEESGMPMPRLREYGNTGPKGVLRDYAEAAERLQRRTEEKKRRLWQMAERNTHATTTVREDDEAEVAEETEDAELERLRAQRLAQLRQQQRQGQQGQQQGRGVCGSPYVEQLGTYDYMRVVQEEACEGQLVAVLLHRDAALAGADALTAAYCALARHVAEDEGRDRDEVRFCAMGAAAALGSFEEDALPALLVYERGQLRDCAMALAGAAALQRAAQRFGLLDAGTARDFTNAAHRHALYDHARDGVAGLQLSDDDDDDDDYDDDDDDEEE